MPVDNEKHPLLVHQIERIAVEDPSRVWASIQRDPDPSKGFRDVTWTELIRAVDRAAHWIAKSLGGNSTSNETLTILAPSDVRYPITLVAAIKTGRKIQFGSPGLTPQGRAALLEKSDCTVVLCDADQYWLSAFDELAKERPAMRRLIMPEVNDWLAPGEVEPYPYSETWEEVVDQPVACFHTSGTTGAPKPVVYRNSSLGVLHSLAALRGSDPSLSISTPGNGRVLSTFPFFHVGGINMGLWVPAFFSGTPVLPWPYILPTPEHVVGGIRYGNVQAASLIPSVLESMARDPEQLKLLKTLKAIRWGSGPLSQACGDLMSRSVPFFQTAYGSTEMCFPLTRKVMEPEDWSYIDFHPYAGLTFEPRDNGLYELVVNRIPEYERYQSIWTTKPELTRYESNDLWRPHPTKPTRWQFAGRRDDMLALSTGYKLFIADKEQTIKDHPLVKSALLGGQGRSRPFLLLELYDRAQDQANGQEEGHTNGHSDGHTNGHAHGTNNRRDRSDTLLLDTIWPTVEKANKTLVGEMRLSRELTVIAPREKPFARTGKDSVDRRRTFSLFEREIEALYQ